mgnify:CR=1 FL=1
MILAWLFKAFSDRGLSSLEFRNCRAVRREIHESCSRSGEEQNRRFKSTCIRASFSRYFDLAVEIFTCAHFRTSLLARARAHSRDVCRTCESKAMRRQFHDHSHVFFVVTMHQFSKSCYFSSQKHGFRFLVRCVALNFGIAVATCALAAARSKVLQEGLMCALARARSKVAQCCSNMGEGQILEFRFLEGNYRHFSHVVDMIAKHRHDHE